MSVTGTPHAWPAAARATYAAGCSDSAASLQDQWQYPTSALATHPHGGGCSCSGSSPITPATAHRPATITPAAASQATTAAAHARIPAATLPAGASSAATAAQQAQQQQQQIDAALERRVHSFLSCVASSALVQSALLSLEVDRSHPPPAGAPAGSSAADGSLEWTLAQLMALFLRTRYARASESCLLAALWTLEGLDSCRRSSATACLSSYLHLLAAFSPELVRRLTKDWPSSFRSLRRGLVAAQVDLLKQLDWRVLLPFDAEVDPCLDRAAQLSDVCAAIRGHAAPLAADASVREESSGSDESTACAYNAQAAAVEETPSGPATKRRRVDAFP